jgi:glycosyltransferase involved in cell wall biosynthesis
MKLLACLQDFPLPANAGIRADIWRRLKALRELGHEIDVITWTGGRLDPALTDEHLTEVQSACSSLKVFNIDRSWRRIARLARYPSQIAGRIFDASVLATTLGRFEGKKHDAVWIDGIHASGAGLQIARALNLPFVYRSHNQEARFLAEQTHLARGIHKLSIRASNFGMAQWELSLMRKACIVFDISIDDVVHWRSEGVSHSHWLPPLADPVILGTSTTPYSARDIDFFYIGGLASPNNVAGINWFASEVMPILRAALPYARVVVAGRSPSSSLTARLEAVGIEVIANPPDAAQLFARSRVMFNPIFSGSGVNIKTVDMLASGRPLVSTQKGARGLPRELLGNLAIADDAKAFADKLRDLLKDGDEAFSAGTASGLVAQWLGSQALIDSLARLAEALSHNRVEKSAKD